MRGRLVLAFACGAVLAVPASAQAGTASVMNPGGKAAVFLYEAGAGEKNRLSAEGSGFILTVKDKGAEVEAGPGCESLSNHRARCDLDGTPRARRGPVLPFRAQLGAKADKAELGAGVRWSQVEGGAGPDALKGGEFLDSFDGGKSADRIRGGGGEDFVTYSGRDQAVVVTLGDGARNDGGPQDGQKRDLLLGIEDAQGGNGDDVLVGTDGVNQLFGEEGKDSLRGGDGADGLFGGEGKDTLHGENGGDSIQGGLGDDREVGGAGGDAFGSGISVNGADLILGGGDPGDFIGYAYPVRILLDGKPNDGACEDISCATTIEKDDVRGVRIITSFTGADLLVGSSAAETFRPSLGADVVNAKGGDDTIDLSPGDGPDSVNCGGGTDTVIDAEGEDSLANCEL